MIELDSVKYLCFGSGGTNGWIYLGMLQAIEKEFRDQKKNLHNQLQGVSGSSVGSLLAVGVNLNFGAIEMREFWKKASIKYANRFKINLFNISAKGLISTDAIRDIVRDLIATKYGSEEEDMTMQQMYERTQKTCVIAAHNLSYERAEIIDHRSFPNMPVWKAVAMSCAIPGLFQPVEHNNCVFTDGGVSNHFPFEFFPLSQSLAFYLEVSHGYVSPQSMSVMDFFCRTLHGFDSVTKYKLATVPVAQRQRLVILNVPCCLKTTLEGFELTVEQREQLINIGYHGAMTLFHYETALLSQAIFMFINSNAHRAATTTTTTQVDDAAV